MPLADSPPGGSARGLSRTQLLLCVAYAALLAYLSFIPFIYRPLPFDEALRQFAQLPYLALGAQSRADWVANLVMYVPLGWLLGRLLQPAPRGRIDAAVLAGAVLLGGTWGVAVEFAQLYYPNRTASLNDVIAEVIGTGVGAVLWLIVGARWKVWWDAIVHGGERTARAALNGYVIAYLVLSLSPFDFILSGSELADHLASPLVGLWMAGVSCGPVPCSARLLFEIALTAPLGLWLALHRRHGVGIVEAVLAGLVFGVVLEAMQLLLVSGVSQGASVLSRGAGIVLGTVAYAQRSRLQAFDRQRYGRPVVLALLLPYLWAVGFVNGWWQGAWIDPAAAWERFGHMRWLPFHFHYFTTEQNAIRSGILHTLLYVPVGLAAWLWSRRPAGMSAARPALLAAAIAVVAELGKLFVPPRHPDMTDVLIAAVAAGATAALLRAICRPAASASISAAPLGAEPAPEARFAEATPIAWRLGGALALIGAFASVLDFPLLPALLAVALAVYAIALVRVPLLYLWVVPATLPLLDLAPWSGRFFWDEFDLLLLVTIGARLLTLRPRRAPARLNLPRGVLALLALSVAASAAVALAPLAPLDANALSNYLSPYNALRVAKGYLWAVLLLALIARDVADGALVERRLAQGLTLALLGLAAVVVWERAAFTGLFGSGVAFRVAGSVSAMHVGGAYLDALLVALLPFALLLAVRADAPGVRVLGAGALLLGLYAVFVTFSRSTLAATIIGGLVFAVLSMRQAAGGRSSSGSAAGSRRAAIAGVLAVVVLGGLALGASETLRQRLAMASADAGVRQAHWREVLAMFSPTLPKYLFGMGLGAFPREFYLQHSADGNVAAYRLQSAGPSGDAQALVLHGGRGLYVVQRIGRPAGGAVDVEIRGRLLRGEGRLAVGICEATVLYSGHCNWATAQLEFESAVPRLRLPLPPDAAPAVLRPPIVLSLSNATAGSAVAVESVSVKAAQGHEVLRNGDFRHGLDRWFFTSDRHLAWRAHNTVLQVAFEQGLFGLAAWTWIALSCLRRLVTAAPDSAAVAVAAACLAVLAVAQFDSLLDAPRLALLILLLVLFPLRPAGRTGGAGENP